MVVCRDEQAVDSTFTPTTSGKYYVASKPTLYSDTIDYRTTAWQEEFIVNALKIRKQNNQHNLTVYPNPATNIIHLETNGTVDITLTNSTGNFLLTKSINNKDVISVSQFANGIYYIKNKTTSEVRKIVVAY